MHAFMMIKENKLIKKKQLIISVHFNVIQTERSKFTLKVAT